MPRPNSRRPQRGTSHEPAGETRQGKVWCGWKTDSSRCHPRPALQQLSGVATPQCTNSDQTRSRTPEYDVKLAGTISSAAPRLSADDKLLSCSFLEPQSRDFIIKMAQNGSTFLGALDRELLRAMETNYVNTIMKTDPDMLQVDFLIRLVEEVRTSLPARNIISSDKIGLAQKFLEVTFSESFENLEDTIRSHRVFRTTLQDYFKTNTTRQSTGGQSSVSQEHVLLLDQITSEVDTVSQPMSLLSLKRSKGITVSDCSQASENFRPNSGKKCPDVQPLKNNSSELLNENNPQPFSREVAETHPRRVNETSILIESFQLENMDYPSLDEVLVARVRDLPNREGSYAVVLQGIKSNFRLSDLINSLFNSPGLPLRNGQDSSSHTDQACLRDSTRGHSHSDLPFNSRSQVRRQHENTNTACNLEVDRGSQKVEILVPVSGLESTWQSRARSYLKHVLSKNKPVVDRLTSGSQVTKLKAESCSVCGGGYRWPLVLHCCHRFCFPCVSKLYEEGRRCFKCPVCQGLTAAISSPLAVLSLKLDVQFAREMLEADMSPFCCTLCSNSEDAVKFCVNCLAYLCIDCCALHQGVEETRWHQLERSDLKVGTKSDGELWLMCDEHPGQFIAIFCSTCRRAVCETCCHGNHKPHNLVQLVDAVGGAKVSVTSANSEMMEIKNAYQHVLMNLNQSKQRMDFLHRSERLKISEISNHLLEKIDSLRKKATGLSEDTFDVVNAQTFAAKTQLEVFHNNLVTFRKFLTNTLESGDLRETVLMYPLIKNRYCQLVQIYIDNQNLKRGLEAEVMFDPRYPEITSSIQDTFSSLRFQYSCFLTHMLQSPLVRERHHVEPYKPLPYSLDLRCEAALPDSRERQKTIAGAVSGMNHSETLQGFFRMTLPYSRAFGEYGRGEYAFNEPSGVLYLHDSSLAVCDTRNHRIVVYLEDGAYQRTIGQPNNLPDHPAVSEDVDRMFQRTPGKLYFPFRLAQCPKTRNIVVLERHPSLDIQIFSFEGNFIHAFGNSCLQNPRGITVDERGLILVLESKTMNFFIFTPQGDLIHRSVIGTLGFPNDVAASQGTIYISDNRHHCVRCFDYSLNYKESIGNESLTYYPVSVGFNCHRHLVVTDNHNTFNITIFDSAGHLINGFKSRAKHGNCYNVALHPRRQELAVTTRDCRVLVFTYS